MIVATMLDPDRAPTDINVIAVAHPGCLLSVGRA
jgi:hypothetical protein